MAEVHEICEEHGIDLDDESEPSSSQATRADMFDEEEEIRLEDLVGNPWALSCTLCRTFLLIFDFLFLLDGDSDEELARGAGNTREKRQPKKNIEDPNMQGGTALHRACIKPDINLVRELLEQVNLFLFYPHFIIWYFFCNYYSLCKATF